MHVIVNLTLIPMGVGVSVSHYIAAIEPILDAAGVTHQLHANGTNIEGEWDQVFGAIRQCHEAVHQLGAPRIMSSMTFGTRIDREQTMADKLASVAAKRGV